jgi:hypothetical protein
MKNLSKKPKSELQKCIELFNCGPLPTKAEILDFLPIVFVVSVCLLIVSILEKL